MRTSMLLAIAILMSISSAARAMLFVNVGNHFLQPNTPNQEIEITVSGGDLNQGINFAAQIGDGGPTVGGVDEGPSLTGDILAPGAIFELNNTGVRSILDDPLPMFIYLITSTDV